MADVADTFHILLSDVKLTAIKHQTHLLSQTGTVDHVPFIHLAVASWSLSLYPLTHVILTLTPSLYQPFWLSGNFAFDISGGMQDSLSERKKHNLTILKRLNYSWSFIFELKL